MPKATSAPTQTIDPRPGREPYQQDEHGWIAAPTAALTGGPLNRLDRGDLLAAHFPTALPWTAEAALALDPHEPAGRGRRHS